MLSVITENSTSHNTAYPVPLRYTQIAMATSDDAETLCDMLSVITENSTSHNTAYPVPLRYTQIAMATSDDAETLAEIIYFLNF